LWPVSSISFWRASDPSLASSRHGSKLFGVLTKIIKCRLLILGENGADSRKRLEKMSGPDFAARPSFSTNSSRLRSNGATEFALNQMQRNAAERLNAAAFFAADISLIVGSHYACLVVV